jgi:hypothetical protein
LGYARLQLKKDAIPTLFNYTPLQVVKKGQKRTSDTDPPIPKQKSRTSRAVEKRQIANVSFNVHLIIMISEINNIILSDISPYIKHPWRIQGREGVVRRSSPPFRKTNVAKIKNGVKITYFESETPV